ncbi:MAG: DUF1963 domain-containing protein [Paracoccaceae bacterium]
MTDRDPSDQDTALDPDKVAAMVADAAIPSVLLVKTDTDILDGAPGCWLGGAPTLPPEIDWPWLPNRGEPSHPLHFIAQINLAALPPELFDGLLPDAGTLFFFANYVSDVDVAGGSAVILVEEDVSHHPPRQQPAFPDSFDDSYPMGWWAGNKVTSFRRWPVTFLPFAAVNHNAFQHEEYWRHAIRRVGAQFEALAKQAEPADGRKFRSAEWSGPGRRRGVMNGTHRMGGPSTPYNQAGGDEPDTIRLLTVEDDDDLGFALQSCSLAFFIDISDLEVGNFDAVWAYVESD